MSKKLRGEPIYIAPGILGWLDKNHSPHVIDEKTNQQLNPRNINDKITIYERQVKDWFLIPATNLIRYKTKNKGFIVLMICLSYLEGVEQYRRGQNSRGNSQRFFIFSLQRLYPNLHSENQLRDFYSQARCGLFHTGMVQGKIIINNTFTHALEFVDNYDIRVNPKKLLQDIKSDFQNYIQELRTNDESASRFDGLYSNL